MTFTEVAMVINTTLPAAPTIIQPGRPLTRSTLKPSGLDTGYQARPNLPAELPPVPRTPDLS